MGHLRPWLTQPEAQLPKQPLALPYPQGDAPLPLEIQRQGLTVPLSRQSGGSGGLSQDAFEGFQLRRAEARGSARTGPVHQPREPSLLEASDPVLNASWGIAEQLRYLPATHALSDQQHGMEPMIIAGLLRAPDLVLQGQDGALWIGYR